MFPQDCQTELRGHGFDKMKNKAKNERFGLQVRIEDYGGSHPGTDTGGYTQTI